MAPRVRSGPQGGKSPEGPGRTTVYRVWVVLRGVLMTISIVAGVGQHGTPAAVAGVLVVIGDSTVKIWDDRTRR